MRRFLSMIGATLLLALCAAPSAALASDSDSFSISGDPGNNASADSGTSDSYQVDDVSVTWRISSGTSDSFGQGASDSTTDGTTGGSTGGTTGGDSGTSGGSGGHRGSGTIGGGSTSGGSTGGTGGAGEGGTEGEPSFSKKPAAPVYQAEPSHRAAPAQRSCPIFCNIEFNGDPIHGVGPVRSTLTNIGLPAFWQVDAGGKSLHRATQRILPTFLVKAAVIIEIVILAFAVLIITGLASQILFAGIAGHSLFDGVISRFSRIWLLLGLVLERKKKRETKEKKIKRFSKVSPKKGRRSKQSHRRAVLAIAILFTLAGSFVPSKVNAVESTPQTIVYNGQLKNASGTALTTPHSMRFSFWSNADAVPSDLNGDHTINTNATNYAGWTEIQVVKPNSSGYFSALLGSGTSLPVLAGMQLSDLINLHLQVEVKPLSAPITAYEILDPNTSTAIDRSPIRSVPFALNADLLDQHDTGTGSGNIAILGPGGKFAMGTTASGTTTGTFTIDGDNTEPDQIILEFGRTLAKKLTYDISDGLFRFNDDVEIQGNLTVTGLVNGVNLTSIQSSTGALKASSGGALNLNVSFGGYRLNGSVTNYAGGVIGMAASATNYVFFGSGGLAKNSTGFPTDESYIPVAQVTTSAGSILTIVDRRAMSSDDREETITTTFIPNFEKSAFQADGADNVGQLSVDTDNINLKNFYKWTSTKSTLQDYDILLKVPVSEDFVRWSAGSTNPIALTYRTTDASSTNNKLDIQVYDTSGTPVTLSGSATSLASTSWSTTQLEFSGSPVWTAGQDMLIRLKVSAKGNYQMHIGSLQLKYVNLNRE